MKSEKILTPIFGIQSTVFRRLFFTDPEPLESLFEKSENNQIFLPKSEANQIFFQNLRPVEILFWWSQASQIRFQKSEASQTAQSRELEGPLLFFFDFRNLRRPKMDTKKFTIKQLDPVVASVLERHDPSLDYRSRVFRNLKNID